MEHLQQLWRLTPDQVLEALDTPPKTGLSQAEAARRLAEHGPNELIERGLRSPWRILAGQFTEVMVIVLIVAAAISFLIGDLKDTIAAYDRLDFRVNTADVPAVLAGLDLCIASVDR